MNPFTQSTPVADNHEDNAVAKPAGDEFLSLDGLDGIMRAAAARSLQRTLSEIEEMSRQNRWEDIVSLFSPVEEKMPELAAQGLDLEVQLKVAFALGQLKRFDDAIRVLLRCVERDPGNFSAHSSLGYTAYNSLYAAKNREIFLSGNIRHERLELSHRHLKRAQELRPEGVTSFYREGTLLKQIEGKADASIQLFEKAVTNWERLGAEEKARRHQERKNFVKSLYNLAGALLQTGEAARAKEMLDRCLSEDKESNYLSPLFKYFALGKTLYHLNRFKEARDALAFALTIADSPADFVHELLARTWLALGDPRQALGVIEKVPERLRRPYFRWTEADVWCALQDFDRARQVLFQAKERDRRSKHKSLIRLARIEYLLGRFDASLRAGEEALKFFEEKWGGLHNEGLFWKALSLFRLERLEEAEEAARTLERQNPRYPKLDLLLGKLKGRSKGQV